MFGKIVLINVAQCQSRIFSFMSSAAKSVLGDVLLSNLTGSAVMVNTGLAQGE